MLAEFGTLHLEFLYLSEVSGDNRFKEKALKIRQVLRDIEKPKGLYWNYMDVNTGQFSRSNWDLNQSSKCSFCLKYFKVTNPFYCKF